LQNPSETFPGALKCLFPETRQANAPQVDRYEKTEGAWLANVIAIFHIAMIYVLVIFMYLQYSRYYNIDRYYNIILLFNTFM